MPLNYTNMKKFDIKQYESIELMLTGMMLMGYKLGIEYKLPYEILDDGTKREMHKKVNALIHDLLN